MIVVGGTYSWFPKVVAFRHDLCRSCEQESLALATRTYDFLHLFWVPVLPLGRWTRWGCGHCGKDPAQTSEVRRSWKIALLIILALLVLISALAAGRNGDYGYGIWIGRAVAFLFVVLVAWVVLRPQGITDLEQRRALVQPFDGGACPLCGAHMVRSLVTSTCSDCEAEHRPLEL
jgi:hypothetical protein